MRDDNVPFNLHKWLMLRNLGVVVVSKNDSTCSALSPPQKKTNLNEAQVIATLVSLLFGIPGLSWDKPAEHFECFAGQMEVTKAEWRVFWLNRYSRNSRNIFKNDGGCKNTGIFGSHEGLLNETPQL